MAAAGKAIGDDCEQKGSIACPADGANRQGHRGELDSRLWSTAAPTKEANSGCGSKGRDFSSGWNCTPTNQGWSSYSIISGNSPSGDIPEKRMPRCSSRPLYLVLTS